MLPIAQKQANKKESDPKNNEKHHHSNHKTRFASPNILTSLSIQNTSISLSDTPENEKLGNNESFYLYHLYLVINGYISVEITAVPEFQSTIEVFQNDVYGYHVPVPEHIIEQFSKYDDQRVLYVLNKEIKRPGGFMKCAQYHYLLLNKVTVKKLRLHPGSNVHVSVEKDTSEYGMPMPEEMQVVMDQDDTARGFFDQLTPGKQRNLIYVVSKIKNPDKRINKALAIMEHLNEVEGKLDFKMLNETIKKYNNMDRAW